MLFSGHLRFGLISSVAVTFAYSIASHKFSSIPLGTEPLLITFGACLAGSLAPDLDTQSKPSKILAFALFIYGLWAYFAREPYFALLVLTGFSFIKSFNHRTYTHLYSLPLILCIIASKMGDMWWLVPFSIGLCVHYFCDCAGPKKLYPWDWRSWIIIPKIPKLSRMLK